MASYAILTNRYVTTLTAGTYVADWEYATINNGTNIVLKKYIGSSPIVKVPAVMNGMNVVLAGTTNTNSQNAYNGQPFANNELIMSVTIEPGVTKASGWNAYEYFYNCTNLQVVDWPTFNTTTDFGYMFYNCQNLIRVNTPNWYCTNSRNARYVFLNCHKLAESPVHFDAGVFLNGAMDMFIGCQNLKSIPVIENGTNTTIWCDAHCVVSFYDCRRLKNIPIRNGGAGENSFHNCHSLETQPNCEYNNVDMTNMFRNCYNLKGDIVIVNGTYLSSGSWNLTSVCENCYNITGVSFATNANCLLDFTNAFRNCVNLTSVGAINNASVATAMSYAFYNCQKLTSVPFAWAEDGNYTYTFYNTAITTAFENLPKTGNFSHTFANCKKLTSTGSIGNASGRKNLYGTFINCTNLINVPSVVNAYMNNTFNGCSKLTTVGSITNVSANNTFAGCTNITSVGSLSNISSAHNMFKNCSNLQFVNSMSTISGANYMFANCIKLQAINSSITGNTFTGTFYNCQSLSSINLSKSANTCYMNYSFYNCKNLSSLTMPNLQVFGMEHMCQGCTNLTTVHFDYDNTEIEECKYSNYAFAQCYNLKTINIISSNNTSNKRRFYFRNMSYMFQDCSNLVNIPFNKSYFYNSYNSFENCINLKNVVVNHGFFNVFANTFERTNITTLNGITAINLQTSGSSFPYLTTINGYINVHTNNAFSNCVNLTTITNLRLGNSNAYSLFSNCKNLKTVSFYTSGSFTNGYSMFRNCSNLTTIGSTVPLTDDGRYMFSDCVKLTGNIKFNANSINYFTGMFNNTSLSKNVYIPYTMNTSTTINSLTRNSANSANINGNNGVTLYNYWNA